MAPNSTQIMSGDVDSSSLSLKVLSPEARRILSILLNPNKVLPTEGPAKLPRDWRGLASLVNISSETVASFQKADKTKQILDIWIQQEQNATIAQLYDFLAKLDRYDVYDDLKVLDNQGKLVSQTQSNQIALQGPSSDFQLSEDDFITFDDKRYGTPQTYHAYVLYADQDQEFVDILTKRLSAQGFRICTQADLLLGLSSVYKAVSNLISKRCHWIILIYSPDFWKSPANEFFTNHAQAISIEQKSLKLIPCMYRECEVPGYLKFYHTLYYTPPPEPGSTATTASFDFFWDKITRSLELVDRAKPPQYTRPAITPTTTDYLALPEPPSKSLSLGDLNMTSDIKLPIDDSTSLRCYSQTSEIQKKKKKNAIKTFFSATFSGRKSKKAIMVE